MSNSDKTKNNTYLWCEVFTETSEDNYTRTLVSFYKFIVNLTNDL